MGATAIRTLARCGLGGSCPTIWETDDGRVAVQGEVSVERWPAEIPTGEAIVFMDREDALELGIVSD